ncbi:esterase [Catenovulum sp. SX2]|uniref:esterase n=1 Tax=Catenovulum sp. SX2 TaxID=3398614 RepID=UPI003F85B605
MHKHGSFGLGLIKYFVIAVALAGCIQTSPKMENSATSHQAQTIYVRGGFNGWSTATEFERTEQLGIYIAKSKITMGNHGFKLAPSDWSFAWVVAAHKNQVVELEREYVLDTAGGQEDSLFIESRGLYQFTLDLTQADKPKLTIQMLATDADSVKPPHQGEMTKLQFNRFNGDAVEAVFSAQVHDNGLREYVHSTTQALRDPVPSFSLYQEDANLPRVRSGNTAFDALFALAVDEMKLNSVEQIKDGNYNHGKAIDCSCFETGEKWNYVWTRDLSYAAHLSLAQFDPKRVQNSLLFKVSALRDSAPVSPFLAGTAPYSQIIQDTGSGGSWPVSTDRMTWAFGASALLSNLPESQRKPFAKQAYTALVNTIENDRIAAFDVNLGLYMGEQSFLDWREQSYASWIVNDLSSMSTAISLSTNAGHYQALLLAADLAKQLADVAAANKYQGWAASLKASINQHLWLEDKGLYSSLTSGHYHKVALEKFDWLGQSLAIITGIASDKQTQAILAAYPHGAMGAPVIFPQQPNIPVYHNRAIWPFVTAYGLNAAVKGQNVAVTQAGLDTLTRAAALNLSNMENLEWLSAEPILLDKNNPQLSGPVINSKRQLWSVAAYLNLVANTVFGINTSQQGIEFKPFIPKEFKEQWFKHSQVINLINYQWRDKQFDIQVKFAPSNKKFGAYVVKRIKVNGLANKGLLSENSLKQHNLIEIELALDDKLDNRINLVDSTPLAFDPLVYAPLEPMLSADAQAEGVVLSITDRGNAQLTAAEIEYQVYRNGQLLQSIPAQADTTSWVDKNAAGQAHCYAVAARFVKSQNQSHLSEVVCTGAQQQILVADKQLVSNKTKQQLNEQSVLVQWGEADDTLTIDFSIETAGIYAIQFNYHNPANAINLGISNGVKVLQLFDKTNQQTITDAVVQFPHTRVDKTRFGDNLSTPVEVELKVGSYQLNLHDFYNMSYLKSNTNYTAAGGISGISNKFDIYAVTFVLLPLK